MVQNIWCNYMYLKKYVKIIPEGDQLVRFRMSGAKDHLAGAHTATKRMHIFDPVAEELFGVK